ncbi:MAG: HAMP domain-containing sensor histidine kinase, partial [Chitinivibrionales bacterium]|nr:HAMP domain-containing sensor histidine kinase [Chitinivibrionales bacterium]
SEFEEYLRVIYNEALRCRDIVGNLTALGRSDDSRMARHDLKDITEASIKLIASTAAKNNIAIVNRVPQRFFVLVDAQKFKQVILAIVSNALDFSPPGSAVTLAAAASATNPEFVTLTIADNGPGIPAEILPKVFDPFFTTKEVGIGTGMGLPLCHAAMEECGGAIDIRSDFGHGTTLILELPLSLGEEGA